MDLDTFRQRIRYVVVVMMENRSFDHMLGALSLDEGRSDIDGLQAGMSNPGVPPSEEDVPVHRMIDRPYRQRAYVYPKGPPHHWRDVAQQIAGGMSGFVRTHALKYDDPYPESVMGYLTRGEVPIIHFLADEFLVCDRWFSAVPADTFPNRWYGVAGHCGGVKDTNPVRHAFTNTGALTLDTIFHHMPTENWAVFCDTLTMLHAVRWPTEGHRPMRRTIREFEDRCRQGRLPAVSWVAPRFYWSDRSVLNAIFPGTANDDHPPSNIAAGQMFLRRIYEAVSQPAVWGETLLIITYDEHGGFYDHVVPPALEPDEIIDDFTMRGPRVPALMISPYTHRSQVGADNRVFHGTMDHCSVLKLLCPWFGVPPLTARVASDRIASILEAIPEPTGSVSVPPPQAPQGDLSMPDWDDELIGKLSPDTIGVDDDDNVVLFRDIAALLDE